MAKGIKSFIGRKCCSLNSFVRNLITASETPPAPPSAGTCYGWTWQDDNPAVGVLDNLNTGSQDFEMSIDLSQSEADIVMQIKAALNNPDPSGPPMIYDEVNVTKDTSTPGQTNFTFIIKNPNPVPQTFDISGNTNLINEIDCP